MTIFVHTSKESLTFRKIRRRGADGFASSPKEGVLRILSTSAGFKPVNLGPNDKHGKHYTTEDDKL
jgi:hypothetical protein